MESIFNNPTAFDQMFDEVVDVRGVRNGVSRHQALSVSVFDDATDDPIDDNAIDSESESICCVSRECDWRFVRDNIVRGDIVRRSDGREYQIKSVARDSALGWIIKARRSK